MRALAHHLGYSAHSVIADIEKGRRIPSEALIRSYEEHFGVADGSLRSMRRRAMAERAARLAGSGAPPAGGQDGPVPEPAAESVPDVVGQLVTALLAQVGRTIGRWRR